MVPQDPVMLLSFLNLKLRDFYGSLDALCEDLDLNREEILEKMKQINYAYDEENNRFVWTYSYRSDGRQGGKKAVCACRSAFSAAFERKWPFSGLL